MQRMIHNNWKEQEQENTTANVEHVIHPILVQETRASKASAVGPGPLQAQLGTARSCRSVRLSGRNGVVGGNGHSRLAVRVKVRPGGEKGPLSPLFPLLSRHSPSSSRLPYTPRPPHYPPFLQLAHAGPTTRTQQRGKQQKAKEGKREEGDSDGNSLRPSAQHLASCLGPRPLPKTSSHDSGTVLHK